VAKEQSRQFNLLIKIVFEVTAFLKIFQAFLNALASMMIPIFIA
jgi:hypothetical protein